MRQRDFGNEEQVVSLSDGEVSVETALYGTTDITNKLRNKNEKFLRPWTARPNQSTTESRSFHVLYKEELVGQILLWGFERPEDGIKKCSISYWIDEDHNNKGIGTKSVALVSKYALNNCDIDLLEAPIQQDNLASIRLVEKLNFRKTKTIVGYLYVQGVPTNHQIWELKIRDLAT
jgi:RimJ/RimL family protein N-acetyltransferase